ncbi:Leucine-zipper-like transcriptional regulator 1 [Puccinia graminis f. sp. tritici]|uniref:Leucine-zipper-like transcriptional regulator 1 n=1 Tax=Puccinia graminis f. sp. tritici TaxID=56615 RepID=A0A5B0RZ89_PUCGR|nr:Leucine-zipper-like transcriptional regulator 1 [Puccinia graminis f. sp. tritici]
MPISTGISLQLANPAIGSIDSVIKKAIEQGFISYSLSGHWASDQSQPIRECYVLHGEQAQVAEETQTLTRDCLLDQGPPIVMQSSHVTEIKGAPPISQALEQLNGFLAEASQVKIMYSSKISLLISIETDTYEANSQSDLAISQHINNSADYLVGSIYHVNKIPISLDCKNFQLALSSFGTKPSSPNAIKQHRLQPFYELCEEYFDSQFRMIDCHRPEVIGLFDRCLIYKPNINLSTKPSLWTQIQKNVRLGVSYGALFEVTLVSIGNGPPTPFPSPPILKLIISAGGKLTLTDPSRCSDMVQPNYKLLANYLKNHQVDTLWYLVPSAPPNMLLQPRNKVSAIPIAGDWIQLSFWAQENSEADHTPLRPMKHPAELDIIDSDRSCRRVRRGSNVKRLERARRKAENPFSATYSLKLKDQGPGCSTPPTCPSSQAIDQPLEPSTASQSLTTQPQASVSFRNEHQSDPVERMVHTSQEKIFFYFIPKSRQFDPDPLQIITPPAILPKYYRRISFGTCIIAPKDQEAFCKVKFIPFSSMTSVDFQGWEKLVCFFLDRTNYVSKVEINGALMGGDMWADGWRKCSKKGEAFGRYCAVEQLARMMLLANYNPINEAAALREANNFISLQLQHLAPGVFEEYRKVLINNKLPSMAHIEYQSEYDALDFSSFLTFTMNDFFNEPHIDGDANCWTLVCWIPIFNPHHSGNEDRILADEHFDMEGGQFTFREFQVYLDLNEVNGVTVCVFRSTDHIHQTLPGSSPSKKYNRIGFSCQMSQKMTAAVVSYISGRNKGKMIAGQEVQIKNAKKKLAAQK